MRQLSDPKFARAVKLFRLATLARQRLYHTCERYRNQYGVAGNVISGGLYENWPEDAKRHARRLNRVYNRITEAAFKARPPRVQMSTMRDLSYTVTTLVIRQQHGNA